MKELDFLKKEAECDFYNMKEMLMIAEDKYSGSELIEHQNRILYLYKNYQAKNRRKIKDYMRWIKKENKNEGEKNEGGRVSKLKKYVLKRKRFKRRSNVE